MRRLSFGDDPANRLHVLALGAHPDDIEIGCGGTLLRLVAEGRVASVRWVVCSGDGTRADEARNGATATLEGVTDHEVLVLDGRDGSFPLAGVELKGAFESLKAGTAPDLVLTHRREDRHQDHRFISDLTWQTFRDALILEYEIPKYDGDLGNPNLYVEIPEATVRRKIEILEAAFPSQRDRHWYDAETFRSILRIRGIESRSVSGYAEAFEARKLVV
jgi:LmbE family N-acetylglucosaminyl deacetylase